MTVDMILFPHAKGRVKKFVKQQVGLNKEDIEWNSF
jgi:hypothetical protein